MPFGEVTLSWTANVEADLAGYRVYYGSAAGGPFTQMPAPYGDVGMTSTPSAPSVTITSFPIYGIVHFVVTAYDTSNNNSAFSSAVNKGVAPKLFPLVWP